jgi:hypothetical protein
MIDTKNSATIILRRALPIDAAVTSIFFYALLIPRLRRSFQAYQVTINKQEVGKIGIGKAQEYTVIPGMVTIQVTLGDLMSEPLVTTLKGGDTIKLACGYRGLFSFNQYSIYVTIDNQNTVGVLEKFYAMEKSTSIVTILENDREEEAVATEYIDTPPGTSITVRRSRNIQHTISLEDRVTGGLSVGFNITQVIDASIKTEIERKTGRSFTQSETVEHEVTLSGEYSNKYTLCWVDIWRKGIVEVHQNEKVQVLPFKIRESTVLRVLPGKQ